MRLILVIFLCVFFTRVSGEVIVVDRYLPFSSLGKSITYLEDQSGLLDLAGAIQKSDSGAFKQSNVDILNFGNGKSAYWIKLSYINKINDKIYLVVDISNIESIDLYYKDQKGKVTQVHSGSMASFSDGVIASKNYIFNLPQGYYPTKIQDIYVRLRTNNVMVVPLKIATTEQMLGGLHAAERFESVYVGILIALLFFNLSVYIRSKDRTYLYYSTYLVCVFVYLVLYFNGYAYVLGKGVQHFIYAYPHLFLGLGNLAGIAFSYNFLNVSKLLPKIRPLVIGLMACWAVAICFCLLGFKTESTSIVRAMAGLSTVILWSLGIAVYRKGFKPAFSYVLAWTFVLLTTLWIVLTMYNVLPYNTFSFQVAPLCLIFELLLLSMALGDRLKQLHKQALEVQADKLKVQEENLALVNTLNERLERVVESRTKALKTTVQSLEAANADKNRLFSIIAHDLRSPFNSLISLFSLNDMDMLTFEDVKMMLNESRKNFDNIQNTLNNLLYWAQNQMQGIKTAPTRFNVRIMLEELMLVYQPLIVKKNICMDIVIDDDKDVFADLDQVKLVMRNLIDNAIKFTPPDQYINIKIWGNLAHLYVDVCNPVVGAFNLAHLDQKPAGQTSYGTSNERGIGLGLHLCRDFVEKNGGSLRVSKEGECVVLRFNLPKFAINPVSELTV
jgi:signal transduction histidine kinase